MKITVSVIKADVGGIGGHTKPSDGLLEAVKYTVKNSADLLLDYYIGYCGDDVHIVMSHTKGTDNAEIHKLAWDAFEAGTQVAKEEGLYGAGQDLLKDSFSGNVKGMGPGVAELELKSDQMKHLQCLQQIKQSLVHSTTQCIDCLSMR